MENVFKLHSRLSMKGENGFKEVKKAFKSQIGTYMINIIRETENSIEFVYRGFNCFISCTNLKLDMGVRNIAYNYYSIPMDFKTACDSLVPHLIVMLAIEYLSAMILKFMSFRMKDYSKLYSEKIREDFTNNIFKKYIQP